MWYWVWDLQDDIPDVLHSMCSCLIRNQTFDLDNREQLQESDILARNIMIQSCSGTFCVPAASDGCAPEHIDLLNDVRILSILCQM